MFRSNPDLSEGKSRFPILSFASSNRFDETIRPAGCITEQRGGLDSMADKSRTRAPPIRLDNRAASNRYYE